MNEANRRPAGETQKRGALTEGDIRKTIFKMAGPMAIGIVAIMIFNLVDTIYVGRLGTKQLAAMSFTFPVVNMVGSLVMGLGVGVTAVLSQLIGSGNGKEVRCTTRDALILSVGIVIIASVIGILTIDPLFRLIGAEGEILKMIREYMLIWYIGMPFLVIPMVGNSAIRATGDTKTPAKIMVASAVINIVLDPLLIFGPWFFPHWGLAGAAIATVIARASTLVLSLYVLIHREKMISMVLPSLKELMRHWGSVLSIGLPAALTQILIPISFAFLTRLVADHGTVAVAAYGAGGRLVMLVMIVPMALATVMTPFSGQNWGAGKGDRVLGAVRFSTAFALLYGIGVYAILSIIAVPVSWMFTNDPAVVKVMAEMIRINLLEMGFVGIVAVTGSTFNGLKQPLKATALMAVRFFLFVIPLAWMGSHFYGLNGFFAGSASGSILTGILAWFWIRNLDASKAKVPAHSAVAASL